MLKMIIADGYQLVSDAQGLWSTLAHGYTIAPGQELQFAEIFHYGTDEERLLIRNNLIHQKQMQMV
jgi:hypothetical protein